MTICNRFWETADKDSKAECPTVQTNGCAIVHKSTPLQTPAHPEQMKAFTLRSLVFGSTADTCPNAVSSHTLCVVSGTMYSSRQKCGIRNLTFPLHLCHRDLLHSPWWSKAGYRGGYTLLYCKSMPLAFSLGEKRQKSPDTNLYFAEHFSCMA